MFTGLKNNQSPMTTIEKKKKKKNYRYGICLKLLSNKRHIQCYINH